MQAIESKDGYVLIRVRVQPKASRNALAVDPEGRIRVALTAPPVEGAANKALREFVADLLKVPRSAVNLEGGEKSRDKSLSVKGIDEKRVLAIVMADKGVR